ncbi:hypothetical protein DES53_112108 [Roseimicrobium gellanilyticum]|uniref:Uncharacterized protein n=1 Tax=Roseimicrobium gellanilyticum TaxID=748857 RepID=A0A366H7H7_9BACT|nr:hypothetical protein [Roseimicrobium gellanilyticum]RBP38110.1 hypothetical protein DES53_112108 [Roseimicrobium gellanilyticum]
MIFLDGIFFLLPVGLIIVAVDYSLWFLPIGLVISWLGARGWLLMIGGWPYRPGEPGWGVSKAVLSQRRDGETLATIWLSFLGIPWLPVRTWSRSRLQWTSLHWPAVVWGALLTAVALGTGLLVFWVAISLIPSPVASVNAAGLVAWILGQCLPWEVKAQPFCDSRHTTRKEASTFAASGPSQIAGTTCSRCGQKLITQFDGEFTARGKVVCQACLTRQRGIKKRK